MKSEHQVTILFDQPFWIALFERTEAGKYCVARFVISTSEPESAEINEFLERLDFDRIPYTPAMVNERGTKEKKSFKKQQKRIQKNATDSRVKHVYSKAQILLKEQLETLKKERKALSKLDKAMAEQAKFELRQQKKKEKHRGH